MNEELLRKYVNAVEKEKLKEDAIKNMESLIYAIKYNKQSNEQTSLILKIADAQIMLAQLVLAFDVDADKLQGAVEYRMQKIKEISGG